MDQQVVCVLLINRSILSLIYLLSLSPFSSLFFFPSFPLVFPLFSPLSPSYCFSSIIFSFFFFLHTLTHPLPSSLIFLLLHPTSFLPFSFLPSQTPTSFPYPHPTSFLFHLPTLSHTHFLPLFLLPSLSHTHFFLLRTHFNPLILHPTSFLSFYFLTSYIPLPSSLFPSYHLTHPLPSSPPSYLSHSTSFLPFLHFTSFISFYFPPSHIPLPPSFLSSYTSLLPLLLLPTLLHPTSFLPSYTSLPSSVSSFSLSLVPFPLLPALWRGLHFEVICGKII